MKKKLREVKTANLIYKKYKNWLPTYDDITVYDCVYCFVL